MMQGLSTEGPEFTQQAGRKPGVQSCIGHPGRLEAASLSKSTVKVKCQTSSEWRKPVLRVFLGVGLCRGPVTHQKCGRDMRWRCLPSWPSDSSCTQWCWLLLSWLQLITLNRLLCHCQVPWGSCHISPAWDNTRNQRSKIYVFLICVAFGLRVWCTVPLRWQLSPLQASPQCSLWPRSAPLPGSPFLGYPTSPPWTSLSPCASCLSLPPWWSTPPSTTTPAVGSQPSGRRRHRWVAGRARVSLRYQEGRLRIMCAEILLSPPGSPGVR